MRQSPPDIVDINIRWYCGLTIDIESTVDGDIEIECGNTFVTLTTVDIFENFDAFAECPECGGELWQKDDEPELA